MEPPHHSVRVVQATVIAFIIVYLSSLWMVIAESTLADIFIPSIPVLISSSSLPRKGKLHNRSVQQHFLKEYTPCVVYTLSPFGRNRSQ